MRLIKLFMLVSLVSSIAFSKQKELNINFKDLEIVDLIQITSKIINKNILISENIKGKVDFISNKPVKEDELVKILVYTLESKGYTLVDNKDILRVVKLKEGFKSNVPLINQNANNSYNQLVTEVFKVYNADVEYILTKIRHLLSRTGKVMSNKEANSLVITDFQDNINKIKKVISHLTHGAKKNMEIVVLENISSDDAKKNLDEIVKSKFNSKIETEKVSVVSNKENNSIVLIGNNQNIKYLKEYIKSIDSNDSLVKRIVEVYTLKNVEAANVIKIVDSIIGKKIYRDVNYKPLFSIDEETNSIVIMGPSSEVEYVKLLIQKLDKEKAQVYVQARIIEVNDTLVDEIGVKYGILGGSAGSSGLGSFASNLNGGVALPFNPEDIGLSIPDITSGLALGASISLLDEDGALDIVSEPSILAINNKESSIYVGETISVKTTSTVTDGGNTNESFQREDVGLTLKVKPRISNDNKVTLEINTILEDVKTTQTVSGNADTSKKEVITTAIVNNGESVILGGLIQDKEESTVSKIPLLGDLPLLGDIFTHNKTDVSKKSLVIVVTPYIVPKSKDLTYVRNQLAELQILEERFLKQSMINLKKRQIKQKEDEEKFKKELEELDEKLERKTYTSNDENEIQINQHQKRLEEIMGKRHDFN